MWRLVIVLLIVIACTEAQAESMVQRFLKYRPVYLEAVKAQWPDMPMLHVPCGQVEQESWWKPTAELKTSREYGFGFGQITITSRFNNFDEAKKLKPLRDWQWEDRYNPRYQLTYLVLTDKYNFMAVYKLFVDDANRWAGALVSYNAGQGTVLQRRKKALSLGLPSDVWFGGLDGAFLNYEDKLLYGRKLGLMRNEYPRLIFKKSDKYRLLLELK